MIELPGIGSRWYIAGHHWQVISHTERDGEPAVRMRLISGRSRKRKPEFVWVWRLCAKRALPSETRAGEPVPQTEEGRGVPCGSHPPPA